MVLKRTIFQVRLYSAEAQTYASESNSEPGFKGPEYFDIVISGGGMVGTAMAAAIARDELFKGHKIALIESTGAPKDFEMPKFHSNRVSALSKASVSLLKDLGSFDVIQMNRYCKVNQMHVWDACTDSSINLQSEDGEEVAIIVENDLIQASLTKNLKDYVNLKVFYANQIKGFQKVDENGKECIQIQMNNNETIRSSLLIGAEGHNSFVRNHAGFKETNYDYGQMGIVGTVKLQSQGSNNTAWQRFLPTGPLALLPLNEEYSSLVWSIEKKYVKELLSLSDQDFVDRLNHACVDESYKNELSTKVDNVLDETLSFIGRTFNQNDIIKPKITQLPPKVEGIVEKSRGAFPLSFMHSHNYVQNRIALIGDAAHRIHPLAGQGVNLGFGDVKCFLKHLKDNVQSGAELGALVYLHKYESERQKEAFPKIMFIHFLNTLYTTSSTSGLIATPMILARSLGLTLTNRLSLLKKFYIQGAMN